MKRHVRFDQTKGYKKILNFIEEKFLEAPYREKLAQLRSHHDIPLSGYICKDPEIIIHNDSLPAEWKKGLSARARASCLEQVAYECSEIATALSIPHEYIIPSPVLNYIFYGVFGVTAKQGERDVQTINFCRIIDERSERWKCMGQEDKDRIIKTMPITVRISPYASQNHVVNFIKDTYSEIKKEQARYNSGFHRISVVRKKKSANLRRDTLITEHGGSIEETRKALRATYPDMEVPDPGHIGAIRHKMKKRKR